MQKQVPVLTALLVLCLLITFYYAGVSNRILASVSNIHYYYSSQHIQGVQIEKRLKQVTGHVDIKELLCSLPCPEGCDVCCNIPYSPSLGKIEVHHYSAHTGLWNEELRFNNLPLTKNSTVVYVGGNIHGADGKQILDLFNCSIHVFEPVPSFYHELSATWALYRSELGYDATLYNIGLGNSDRIVHLAMSDLVGQGTFGMEENKDRKEVPLQIKEAGRVIKDIKKDTKNKKGSDTIDLLHVNCEGCEWEMFDNLIDTKVLESVKSVQFSAHYFSQVPNLFYRYCKLKEALSKTHKMVYGQSFGWERWDKIK